MPTYKWLCEVTGIIIQIASFVFLSLNTYYFQPYFFFNHLLYSKMWLKLGLGMTPKFHSTLRLQKLRSMTPLHSTQPFSIAVIPKSYFFNWTQAGDWNTPLFICSIKTRHHYLMYNFVKKKPETIRKLWDIFVILAEINWRKSIKIIISDS